MFAVQCSFCQHENIPGARFCAECGSPLHLRVCPNPKCGKVSDVNTLQCEFCGTPFPKIPLAEPGSAAGAPLSSDQNPIEPISEGKSKDTPKASTSAWPLIAVAIVAGGLPLLWFNRASLPTPKTWQNSPEVERLIAPPVLPPAAPITTPTAAAPTQGAESLTLPPLTAPIQPPLASEKVDSAATPLPEGPSGSKASEPPTQEKTKAKQAANAKKPIHAAERATSEPPQPPSRPCTEAATALGLCDAKQAAK